MVLFMQIWVRIFCLCDFLKTTVAYAEGAPDAFPANESNFNRQRTGRRSYNASGVFCRPRPELRWAQIQDHCKVDNGEGPRIGFMPIFPVKAIPAQSGLVRCLSDMDRAGPIRTLAMWLRLKARKYKELSQTFCLQRCWWCLGVVLNMLSSTKFQMHNRDLVLWWELHNCHNERKNALTNQEGTLITNFKLRRSLGLELSKIMNCALRVTKPSVSELCLVTFNGPHRYKEGGMNRWDTEIRKTVVLLLEWN